MFFLARMGRIFQAPVVFYDNALRSNPILTKCITSGAMYMGGDMIAQYAETYNANLLVADEKEHQVTVIDEKRSAVFLIYGTVIAGTAYHYWFNYLNELPALLWKLKQSRQRGKILRAYAYLKSHGIEVKLDLQKLPKSLPLGKWESKGAKILADQLIFSSLYTLVFFIGVGMLTGAADMMELRYLIYQQQQQQRQQRGQVGIGNSSDPPHSSPTTTTTTTTEHSWWSQLLSFPTTATTPTITPTIAAPPTKAEVEQKKFESRYAALLTKYGKVPATVPLSLPSSGEDEAESNVDSHKTERLLDEILAGLRARRQRRVRTANNNDDDDRDDESNSSTSNDSSSSTNSSSSSGSNGSGSGQGGGSEEEDDSSDLLEDLFLRLKTLEGAIRSGGRKDNAVTNFVEITWTDVWQHSWQKVREVYVETFVMDCLVWPPLQLINFTFIPVRLQFLYVNVANLAWNTFLSLMANKSHCSS